ncbi:MAG: hypothetical protein HY308_11560 [Gammaproteobacteria bacterium]|nr:hypothetical protein [Gammaproteobacteria bacterium]
MPLSGDDVRRRDHFYALYHKPTGGQVLRRWDLTSPASLNARPIYTEITTSGDSLPDLGTRPGFVYADVRDQFFAWGGGQDVYMSRSDHQHLEALDWYRRQSRCTTAPTAPSADYATALRAVCWCW